MDHEEEKEEDEEKEEKEEEGKEKDGEEDNESKSLSIDPFMLVALLSASLRKKQSKTTFTSAVRLPVVGSVQIHFVASLSALLAKPVYLAAVKSRVYSVHKVLCCT